MPTSSNAAGWLPAIVCGIFLVVNLVNAFAKAGDVDAYIAAGARLLAREPLYEASTIAHGFVGPPAQALLFLPLAAVGSPAARFIWFVLNVALLWYALTTWLSVIGLARGRLAARGERRGLFGSRSAMLSLAGVAYPLQTQFEHQNLNVVLLALAACAAAAFRQRRSTAGGAALGVAAAVKVYPVVLLVWLALRGQWRALGSGVAVALGMSLAPAMCQGLDGFLRDVTDWWAVAGAGWPARRGNQSMVAMWGRYVLGEGPGGYPILTFEDLVPLSLAGLTSLVAIGPLALAWWRHHASRRRLTEEIACLNALAVLLSPIAWEHYWLAFFPIFIALGARVCGPEVPIWQERRRTGAAILGGVRLLDRSRGHHAALASDRGMAPSGVAGAT